LHTFKFHRYRVHTYIALLATILHPWCWYEPEEVMTILHYIPYAAVLALSLLISAPANAEDEFFRKGQVYENEQRWSEAFSAYTEVLKRDPNNAAAHYRLGVVSDRLGATEAALKSYQEALRLNPGMPEARQALQGYYVTQGVMFRRNNQSDEAIHAFQQALSYNPDSASAHFELGQEFEQRKQFDEAISAYQESIKRDANNSGPHIRLAAIYSTQGRQEQAIHELQEVLRLNPNDPEAHYGLGVAYNAQGQREQAIASLKQAVRFYLIAGKREEARPAYTLQKQLEAEQTAPAPSGRKK
jgi:tetratricopeptide (TPR) repeat protein